ncbi:hypothetical protein O181_028081 [Austropuccinia psidii MF-1]|uniref:Uncharacterized protein n=1 Tax=Austropuccinia psidii MF-1 TaxID=1389203 RepID=A0A9Q3H219_9BASI|nr:hypothetical protein [Austropuccinia psidii MF-1]
MKDLYLFVFSVFEDNQKEDNQTTAKRLVEETAQVPQHQLSLRKRKLRNYNFQDPPFRTLKVPNTPSNQMELDSEVELIPQKGKEREKSPAEHNIHKEVP